jgi:hypothetical protein
MLLYNVKRLSNMCKKHNEYQWSTGGMILAGAGPGPGRGRGCMILAGAGDWSNIDIM